MAESLDYQSKDIIDYGLATSTLKNKTIMLLHGTTWPSKEWPEPAWTELANLIRQDGFDVMVPAGNRQERERATQHPGRTRRASGSAFPWGPDVEDAAVRRCGVS